MSGPPKMRLPYAGKAPLRLVSAEPQSTDNNPLSQKAEALYRGIAYPPQRWRQWANDQSLGGEALMSGFAMTIDQGKPLPLQADGPAYIWDGHSEVTLAENECQLIDCSLKDLTIEQVVGGELLAITPTFLFAYKTLAFAAQLGEIRLVTANRFVTDAEGKQHSLLNTEDADEPVLYLEGLEDSSIVRQQTAWQSLNTQQEYRFDYRIQQPLLREWRGTLVKSVTVLEQYTSYFMQRAISCVPDDCLWVPAYAPITWGWSLRVERDHDDWVITRRKLVMPVVGHDGWQYPQWQGNTLNFAKN